MLSITKYIFESLTRGEEGINPGNGILRAARNYWTPIRGRKDVQEARESEAGAWAPKIAAANKIAQKAKEEAANAKDNIEGTEAAGIAAQKGAHAAGEAVGGLGKKVGEFAGEHPAAAALAGGLGLGYLLRKRKQQNNQ